MTDHPITPPPKLVEKWIKSARYREFMPYPEGYEQYEQRLTTIAARWGADMELEACCEWLDKGFGDVGNFPATLRAARRPRPTPPSLKGQALKAWDRLRNEAWCEEIEFDLDFVRRALEELND
jgi:hypothetical protein